MRKLYKIEFTKEHKPFKKGQTTDQFSRDIAKIFVEELKVAKFVNTKKTKSKK